MHYSPLRGIDHSGNSDTDTFTSTDFLVIDKDLLDASRELLNQHIDFAIRLKTADDAELPAHQIGDDDVSSRRTNIDTHNATLPGVDEEKRWSPSTTDRFADSAFEDQRLAQEFADQETGDAASHIHESREVSARHRLVSANEIQCNLSIDFAARTATCDLEIVWVDLAHRANCS